MSPYSSPFDVVAVQFVDKCDLPRIVYVRIKREKTQGMHEIGLIACL